jgi:gas vesicle protein
MTLCQPERRLLFPGMTDAAWTLAGTALGAIIAGLVAWLNNRAQSGRERSKEDRLIRRSTYTEFLHSTESLQQSVIVVADELDRVYRAAGGLGIAREMMTDMRAELDELLLQYEKARQALELSGSEYVADWVGQRNSLRLFMYSVRKVLAADNPDDRDWDDVGKEIRERMHKSRRELQEAKHLMRTDLQR